MRLILLLYHCCCLGLLLLLVTTTILTNINVVIVANITITIIITSFDLPLQLFYPLGIFHVDSVYFSKHLWWLIRCTYYVTTHRLFLLKIALVIIVIDIIISFIIGVVYIWLVWFVVICDLDIIVIVIRSCYLSHIIQWWRSQLIHRWPCCCFYCSYTFIVIILMIVGLLL